ncbi:hypothetical protein [Neobacillus massiliamazoniensis]|uniref:Uncharacterized protein n=1 Tax=Neobacillus massiliamazoniensis TaxID=1499688 RepID=A0A0U1NS31_9BACI|nr:hypothetical protein [Neobacillus massiliamazoniensis]CRK80870.1 hypothetical protein BN000_00760 [Neobacillus massiliamazoniensis]
MAVKQSHMTGINEPQYIPPQGDYETFRDENHFKEKLKEWGLSSAKKEFWYKDRSNQLLVTIKGYETYGKTDQFNTVVIEFHDGKLSCIHPAYLKEMQQSSFGKESLIGVEEVGNGTDSTAVEEHSKANEVTEVETKTEPSSDKKADEKPVRSKESKPKKEKAAKLELPADKVHFTASVKQFALTYNAFNEENDEVVVLENVQIAQENPIDLGLAWCSHSKTLKKLELAPGESLEFDGKVVAKKLAKGKDVEEEFLVDVPVLYKINNPSKIIKK